MCVCVFSITYVPAEYLEEYKASLEQVKDIIYSEGATAPAPKYVPKSYHSNLGNVMTLPNSRDVTLIWIQDGNLNEHNVANVFLIQVFFTYPLLLVRDVPNLPEREDGEGEESASYSNWNQPRK